MEGGWIFDKKDNKYMMPLKMDKELCMKIIHYFEEGLR
jgi:hypothetical protein